VENGTPRAAIVAPGNDAFAREAATDLQYHLRRASGAELPILTPEEARQSPLAKVYLNAPGEYDWDQVGRNGFFLHSRDGDLYVAGRGEGVTQAVDYLLEQYLGVRWLWPGALGEVIPKRDTIALPELDVAFRQPIRSSRIHPSNAAEAGWQSHEAWENFNRDENVWLRRHGFSWDSALRSQHSFTHPGWNYQTLYLKSHPEYFQMLPDGTRRPNPYHVGGAAAFIGICPSSAGLLEQVLKDWREKRATGYPWGPNLYLGESDTNGSCCCPACLAADHSDDPGRLARAKAAFEAGKKGWELELGNVTDRYMEFYLKAQAEAKKTDPDVKVIGWAAYGNYYDAPKFHKLNSDIVVAFVGRLMYPWTQKKIDDFHATWQGWRDAGATMILRPNFMLDGHNMPINFARKFHALYQTCLAEGMIATEFDSNIGQYGGNGLNYYVMARMTRNPELSYEEIYAEYCDAFGAAAPAIREYWDYWEHVSDSEQTTGIDTSSVYNPVGVEAGDWNYFYMIAPKIYTPEVLAKGFAILDRAARLAAGDETALARVAFLRDGLRDAELTVQAQEAYESQDKYALAAAVTKLDAFRASIEPRNIANMNHLTRWENITWDRDSLRFLLNAPGDPLPDNWRLMWDPEDRGAAAGAAAPAFDDSSWYPIGIDSGWEKQQPGLDWKQAHHGQDYDGVAWYRNDFTLPADAAGASVTLTFGAVDEACTVYVNGVKVLERPYPYQGDSDSWMKPFSVDISKAVRFGQPNVLAVRVVDTAHQGGIWRPVWVHCSRPSSPGNAIRNGGFEDGQRDRPDGFWPSHGPAGKHAIGFDATTAHSGNSSYRLECLEVNPDGANLFEKSWMRIFQEVPVTPGAAYDFRVWYRTSPGYAGSVRVWVFGEGVKYEINAGETDGLWLELKLDDCKMGPATDKVTVYLNIVGAVGAVWFDDAELCKR